MVHTFHTSKASLEHLYHVQGWRMEVRYGDVGDGSGSCIKVLAAIKRA